MKPIRSLLLAAGVWAALASPVVARSPFQTIDTLVDEFMSRNDATGIAVGWVTPEGDSVLTRGVECRDRDGLVGRETAFEIGSITKAFVGLLLADMAVRGEVDPADPLSAHLSDGSVAPAVVGREITLMDLITHTSGLPRLPGNMQPADMADPYADYTVGALHEFLAGYEPPRPPGTEYEYSNLGVGLLAALLAERAGWSQDELLRSRVLEPLALSRTYLAVVPGKATPGRASGNRPLACGHAVGATVPHWHFDVMAGAGGMRSTPTDLLRFLRVQLDPTGTPLADAVRASHATVDVPPPGLEVAFAWHVTPLAGPGTPRGYWHNGGTGGFRSFIGFVPELGTGVLVLSNDALPFQETDGLALEILRSLDGRPAEAGDGETR